MEVWFCNLYHDVKCNTIQLKLLRLLSFKTNDWICFVFRLTSRTEPQKRANVSCWSKVYRGAVVTSDMCQSILFWILNGLWKLALKYKSGKYRISTTSYKLNKLLRPTSLKPKLCFLITLSQAVINYAPRLSTRCNQTCSYPTTCETENDTHNTICCLIISIIETRECSVWCEVDSCIDMCFWFTGIYYQALSTFDGAVEQRE